MVGQKTKVSGHRLRMKSMLYLPQLSRPSTKHIINNTLAEPGHPAFSRSISVAASKLPRRRPTNRIEMISMRVLLLLQLLILLAATSSENLALPGCPGKCGSIAVPYPFGIGTDCFRPGFEIACTNGGPRALIPDLDLEIEVIDISIAPPEVRVSIPISYQCYNATSMVLKETPKVDLSPRPAYLFSSTRNKFTALGCFTLAHIAAQNDDDDYQYAGGCVAYCQDEKGIANGSCSSMGCCQASIPEQLNYIDIYFRAYDYSTTWNISPCSYGFLVAQDSYNFTRSDLSYDFAVKHRNHTPVVLDWAIRNQSCHEAKADPTTYACRSSNSICHNATNGPGYFCSCSPGYDGNPYLQNGCQGLVLVNFSLRLSY